MFPSIKKRLVSDHNIHALALHSDERAVGGVRLLDVVVIFIGNDDIKVVVALRVIVAPRIRAEKINPERVERFLELVRNGGDFAVYHRSIIAQNGSFVVKMCGG